jgi:hypothetical protein
VLFFEMKCREMNAGMNAVPKWELPDFLFISGLYILAPHIFSLWFERLAA